MSPRKSFPRSVSIMEVGPRDGLQSEEKILSVRERFQLIRNLEGAGLKDIEAASFVRSDRVPQLADSDLLLKKLKRGNNNRYWSFVPNLIGLKNAHAAGVGGVAFFMSVSSTFCKKNVNLSRAEQLKLVGELIADAKKRKLKFRVYLSTVFHCPYEGWTPRVELLKTVSALLDLKACNVVLSDTTGRASPGKFIHQIGPLVKQFGANVFSLHLHNTQGMALANINEALAMGLCRFDSSIGGMGGCPYAPGATGNVATEELVCMLQSYGYLKNVKLDRLLKVGRQMEQLLGRRLPSALLRSGIVK